MLVYIHHTEFRDTTYVLVKLYHKFHTYVFNLLIVIVKTFK